MSALPPKLVTLVRRLAVLAATVQPCLAEAKRNRQV